MLYRSLITEEEFITIGCNLIGNPIEKIDLLHDEFLADVVEIEEAYASGLHIIPNSGNI